MLGWWSTSGQSLATYGDRLVAIGRLFGLLAAWCVILQIILMSRVPFMERYFDLHENMKLHEYNGYALLGTISGHIIFLVLGYALPTHVGLVDQTIAFVTQYSDVLIATVGTVIFFVAASLSLRAIRTKMPYEIWYLLHLTVYLAIAMTFLHQVGIGGDFIHNVWFTAFWYAFYTFAFVIWLRYRVFNIIILELKHGFRVSSVTQVANNTYSVTLTGRNVATFAFKPGQYATWRIMSRTLFYEAHPFSISSPAGADYLQFTVKASPSFTERVARLAPGTPVLVDGPRGSFTAERAVDTRRAVLIAGGIGITPYMSTIEELLAMGKEVTLLYSARTQQDVAFRQELLDLQAKGVKISLFLTEHNQIITDDVLRTIPKDDTTVYVCGPDAMSISFAASLEALGIHKKQIITERFAF